MTTTTHYCDKCSERIDVDRSELTVEAGPLLKRRSSETDTIELCGPCAESLARWLAAPALAHEPAGASGGAEQGEQSKMAG